jgi:hypothetical protein
MIGTPARNKKHLKYEWQTLINDVTSDQMYVERTKIILLYLDIQTRDQ